MICEGTVPPRARSHSAQGQRRLLGWSEYTLVGRSHPKVAAPLGWKSLTGQRLFLQQSEFGHFLGHWSTVGKKLNAG